MPRKPTRYASLLEALIGGPQNPTLKTQIKQTYGTTRHGTPDTKAAAQALGVSQRTVQRWIKTGKLPSSPKGQAAAEDIQTWRDSPAGRSQRIGPRRSQNLSKGFKADIMGVFRVSSDERRRTVKVPFDERHANNVMNAILTGDDDAAHRALEEGYSAEFGGSVEIEIASMRIY